MFASPNQSRRSTVVKALVALILATGCVAAVAYAATKPAPGGDGSRAAREAAATASSVAFGRPSASRAATGGYRSRPRITQHPAKTSLSSTVAFAYSVRPAQVNFQCKLDSSAWKRCSDQVFYRGLAPGPHLFQVRLEGKRFGRGLPTRFRWTRTEPKGFLIEADLSGLAKLYPGGAPVVLPLELSNPNPAPILITALRVTVTASPPGCASASNLELIPSNASPTKPVRVPAGGSVKLPATGVSPPALALRNLPVDQDACQGAQFPLAFSGSARG
jgi:hypothetical protein